MIITITEFSEQRNEDRDTVNAYIRKHPEIQKDVSKKGKNTVIDTASDGYALLDKQYPLPKPIEVIEDTESRAKLIKTQELVIQLQDKLNRAQMQIAQAEATKILLEDKETQLEREYERSAKAEERATTAEGQMESLRTEIEKLQEELERERAKTWVQKLFGKG